MNETLVVVLSTIWSLFAMYLIVWKLKINKFEEQMEESMDRAVEDYVSRIKARSELAMEAKAGEILKDMLIEARVVDSKVEMIFTKRTSPVLPGKGFGTREVRGL